MSMVTQEEPSPTHSKGVGSKKAGLPASAEQPERLRVLKPAASCGSDRLVLSQRQARRPGQCAVA